MKKFLLVFAVISLGVISSSYAKQDMAPDNEKTCQISNYKNPMIPVYWIAGGLSLMFLVVMVFKKNKPKDPKNDEFENVDDKYKKFRRNGNVSTFVY